MRLIPFVSLFALVAGCASSSFTRRPSSAPENSRQIVDSVIQRMGPVRRQRGTNICFGHAVADVATVHSGQRVSAFSVAVRNFQHRDGLDYALFQPGGVIAGQVGPDSRFMLGLASSTLKSALKGTLCADDQPVNDISYKDSDLKQLWDTYHSEFRPYFGPTAPLHLYRKIEASLALITPGLDGGDFTNHMNRSKPLDQALGEWLDRQCKIRIPNAEDIRVVGSETKRNTADANLRALNAALDMGEPAVAHIDLGYFDGADPSFWQSVIGFHVVTIVAKAEWNGARHYLLRNSWGASCRHYAPQIEARCDRGHIWLTEDEVRRYVTSVAYLQAR